MASTINELSVDEVHELCQRYLRQVTIVKHGRIIKTENFDVLSYSSKPTSDAPAGFLGLHQFLTVDVWLHPSQRGEEHTQRLHFFTKSAPSEASRVAYMEEFGVFKKEIAMYRDVLPKLQRLLASMAPKCYYENGRLLVFEDLSQRGFRMAAARDGILNYKHLKCALKALAILHATSIMYEQHMGKTMPELHPTVVVENAYPLDMPPEHVRTQNFNLATAVCLEIIKSLPQYDKQRELVLEAFPQQMAKIFPLAQTSTQYRNVLLHGDLWANNVMYRYGKNTLVPSDCRFVDFQLARYAPALLDVLTLLTIPTTRSFRQVYLDDLLKIYYRFMKKLLKRVGLSADQHFMSFDEYWRCAMEFRICGLIESCLFSHLTVLPTHLTQRLTGSTDAFSEFFTHKRVDICMEAFNNDRVYRERMTNMIGDIVDNFILQNNCYV